MNTPWLNETTLKGNLVTLVPLKREHANALLEAASDGELWNLWYTSVPSSKTIDAYLDQASRTAIARLGAKQDGVLRNHQKSAEGVYRDTVIFSIIDQEWPCVKKSLEQRMLRTASQMNRL